MEYLMDDLELADMKEETLHRCLDQLHAEASSILSFTLEWKDLEAHLDSVKACLSSKVDDLALLEKKNKELLRLIEERHVEVEIKEKKCDEGIAELKRNENRLGLVKNWIQECELELNLKEENLNSARQEVEDCNVELGVRKEELRSLKNEVESKEKDLGSLEKLVKEILEKDEKLGSIQKSVERCLKDLKFNEKEVQRTRKLIANCDCDLAFKQKELRKLTNLISDYNGEILSKEMQLVRNSTELDQKKGELDAIQISIERFSEELDFKWKELDGIKEPIKECLKELDSKEMELNLIKRSIEESTKEFELRQHQLQSINALIEEYGEEIEAKEKEHDEVKKSIKECTAEFHRKEKLLDSVRQQEKHCTKSLESKEEEINKIEKRLHTYYKDLEFREMEFNVIQMSIEDRSEELERKRQQLKSVQVAVGECEKELKEMEEQKKSIVKSIVECSMGLELKVKDLVLARESLRKCCDELELKRVQLDSIQRSSLELDKKFEEKEKHLNSLEKTLEERQENLAVKERQFEERVKETELKQKQLHFMQQSVEKECKEKQLGSDILSSHRRIDQPEQVRNPRHASSSTFWSNAIVNERSPPLVNDCMGEHELMHQGVSADPAKFVLDVLHGSFSQNWKDEVTGFDASVKMSKVLLLEQLMKVSQKISPQLKEAATSLAVLWGQNMGLETKDSMEILAFLLFLAAYGLVSCFSRDKIWTLVGTIAHRKQAPEIFQVLGFADKFRVQVFIQNLIDRKQRMAAARFSCAFGLVHSFPPELILKEHVKNIMINALACKGGKNSMEVQLKATDNAISALRSILELLADYKYDSRTFKKEIISCISELENKRTEWTQSFHVLDTMTESQLQGRKYCIAGISVSENHPASASSVQSQAPGPNFRVQPLQQANHFRNQLATPIVQPHLPNTNFQVQVQQPIENKNKRLKVDVSVGRLQVAQVGVAYGGPTQFSPPTNYSTLGLSAFQQSLQPFHTQIKTNTKAESLLDLSRSTRRKVHRPWLSEDYRERISPVGLGATHEENPSRSKPKRK